MVENYLLNTLNNVRYAFYIRQGETKNILDNPLAFLSDKVELFAGLSAEEIKRKEAPWYALIANADRTKYINLLENMVVGESQVIHYRIVNQKEKGYQWLRDKVSLITTDEGKHLLCGDAEPIFTAEERYWEQMASKEAELISNISEAALRGVGFKELSKLLLDSLSEITGVQGNRFYLYDEARKKLTLESESAKHLPMFFIESHFGIRLKDFMPILKKGSLCLKALETGRSIITTDKKEIEKLIKEHTDNKTLRRAAPWARSFLNIKTYGIIPLMVNETAFGLVEFTTPKVLGEAQIASIKRFTTYVSFALSKQKVQEDLERERDFYEKLLHATPVEIVIMDEQGRYEFINEYANKDAEVRKTVIGMTDREYYLHQNRSVDDLHKREKRFTQALETQKPVSWEDKVEKKGQLRTVWRKYTPLYRGGKLYRMLGYGVDITSLKKIEAEREALIQDLSIRIAEQTEYNYIVSHHLRAPVASLLGLTGITHLASSPEEQLEMLSYVRESAEQLDSVLRDLSYVLTLKSESNIKPEEFYIKELVEGLENQYKEELKELDTWLDYEIDKNCRRRQVYSYKSYIENILKTLISNAIVYRATERKLELKILVEDVEDKLRISVKDNGLGIDLKRHQKNLFGLYKRFHPTHPGRGLGLHIAKNQVNRINGHINVQSALNKGSTFSFEFPYRLVEEE